MTASSSIKTPSMSVPLLHTQHAIENGHALKKLFTKVSLAEVIICIVSTCVTYVVRSH